MQVVLVHRWSLHTGGLSAQVVTTYRLHHHAAKQEDEHWFKQSSPPFYLMSLIVPVLSGLVRVGVRVHPSSA